MLNYFKGDPSKFIIRYKSGKPKKGRRGLSFRYLAYHTQIVAIPATTIDSNFIFNEMTNNYQAITLQGHYTYIIKDPKKMNTLLDFSIDPISKQYLSTDPEKLELRITNVVQMEARSEIARMTLEDALASSKELADIVLERAKKAPILTDEMGIEILSITINSIRPTPEISKALEADYRELLQKKADEAIYERRAAAVEQERKIKENELNTQITLEEKKKHLIELKNENKIKEAEVRSKVYELELEPYAKLDPTQLLAFAMKELAFRANKIGNLTITSEILSSLLKDKG